MPQKKNSTAKKSDSQTLAEDVKGLVEELSRVSKDIKKLAKSSKKKIDAVDTKTKTQVVAALGALATILTVRKVAKKISSKSKGK